VALQSLAGFLALGELASGPVCDALVTRAWRCETRQVESWEELLEFDRPAVLKLLLPARFSAHAVLVGISGESGTLLHDGGELVVPLADLGPLWRGEFVFMWQPPEGYSGPVKLGDSGPVVAWLAQAFAAIDGQSQALTGGEFNAALDTRVRLFQRQFKLRDDGVVGLKTLLKLDAVGGGAASLRDASAVLASLGEG
jgi:general secretion pathway protein A